MATLGDIRTELRERKLVETSTDFYTDATLLNIVIEASREIAYAFRFPKSTANIAAAGAGATNLVTVGVSRFVDVESLTVDGLSVGRRTFQHIKFLQQLPATDWTRGFYFNRASDIGIAIGPPTAGTPTYTLEYVKDPYSGTPIASNDVWGGIFSEYHELVTLRSAALAFEMGFEFERAGWYTQRYQQLVQEMANFLQMPVPVEVANAPA